MHRQLKEKARTLRISGKSIREIEKELNTSRSNVSVWVRDIILTKDQLARLEKRPHSRITVEKRRESRLRNGTAQRTPFLTQGIEEIEGLQSIDVMMLAIGIYMGEGTKTSRGTIALSNSDPRIIQIFVMFLEYFLGVHKNNIRAHVGIHSCLSAAKAEAYWSRISGIPRIQFIKTAIQRSRSSKGERDRLPFGTFTVYVHNTKMRIRLEGLIQGVYKRLFPHETQLHNLTKLKI